MKKELPELLMPGGSVEKIKVAFRYGADAVYCGCPMFSLRTRENKVTEDDLKEIVALARKLNKKVYVTINAFPHQFLMKMLEKHCAFLEELKPDGIIFADMGVLAVANEFAPSIEKHLSVQTSTMNIPAIKTWWDLGVRRVICAREMAIREVAMIHKMMPEMELEYFVHGAVCMAYSGRCLLSSFTGGRDANCGACNHTCRWNYQVYDEDGRKVDVAEHFENADKEQSGGCGCGKSEAKSIRDFEGVEFAEEELRQDQMIPIEQDFHGTHIMSSRDMCMIEFMREIQEGGVCSLKVEGRNKTPYYVATVARAYREALDDLAEGKDFNPELWEEIHATANRGYFPGFLRGKPEKGDIQYEGNQSTCHKEFCGVVTKCENGRIEFIPKNRVETGAELEFVMDKRKDDFWVMAQGLKFGEESVEVLHGGDTRKKASFACDSVVPEGTFIRQKTQNPSLKPREKAAASYAV